MLIKFILFLFIGFLSTFIGATKGEEICSFTSAEEYEKCFNNIYALRVPNYPLLIKGGGGANKYKIVQEFTNNSCTGSSWSPNLKRLHLGSITGKELLVKEGVWKRFTNKNIKVYKDYEIPSRKIIQWSKEKIYCNGIYEDFYSVSYLSPSFNLKKLYFRNGSYGTKKGDLISRMSFDINEVQNSFLSIIEIFIRDPLTIVFTLTAMFIISYKLTIFVILFIPISGFIISFIGKTLVE